MKRAIAELTQGYEFRGASRVIARRPKSTTR